jgi:hypothetical protein
MVVHWGICDERDSRRAMSCGAAETAVIGGGDGNHGFESKVKGVKGKGRKAKSERETLVRSLA